MDTVWPVKLFRPSKGSVCHNEIDIRTLTWPQIEFPSLRKKPEPETGPQNPRLVGDDHALLGNVWLVVDIDTGNAAAITFGITESIPLSFATQPVLRYWPRPTDRNGFSYSRLRPDKAIPPPQYPGWNCQQGEGDQGVGKSPVQLPTI
jgi:hypothetical protein